MQIRPDYFSGAILNVPWFANHENSQLGYFKRMLLKTMSTLFRNRQISLPNKTPEYDEFLTYLINKDPYYTGPIQFHMVEYGLTLQDQMNAQLDRIPNVPIYIVVAENEWVVSNNRILEISNMLKHPKNKTVTYKNAVHALFYQDGFYQQVMGDLLDWLLEISQ
ncbi:UNKNOWN [Stylonychia lemnae]|uniref:Serine aminopeptidase S33 domain-containing protein n=1 Tax=Stylonychia lemnae TaxID=5949 RepID=A0A077ZPL3_STYLE|nr:UNKNOWN [Stylonychia lemnae]|eukprot:CDW71833.1 UNKNOWN [Stylonychia lemnae]